MKTNKICKRFQISGKVQGVWYRATTQKVACELGLTGYAKNLSDGKVEVIACGDLEQIEQLSHWLWQGPPNADVSNVTEETLENFEESEGFETF
jgi:acylphosphatase